MNIALKSPDIKKFHQFLKSNPDLVRKHTSIAMKKSLFALEATATRLAPVDTGHLQQNIRSSYTPLRGTVTPTPNYSIYVHEGTRFQKARPFLTNAMKKEEKKVVGFFTQALTKIITDLKNG